MPSSFKLGEEGLGQQERIGAVHAGDNRRVADHGQYLVRHFQHDVVGVAVGQQPGERTAACHAIAAGVVEDDQIDPACFLAFR